MTSSADLVQLWSEWDGGDVLDALFEHVGPSVDIYELLDGLHLGDGLPVGIPSVDAIAAMLGGRDPQTLVATVPPLRGKVTTHRLAVCAVLAGCRPAHFPVLMAAVAALPDERLNAYGILSTTGSAAIMMVVNGPKAVELEFNSESNCLGPGNRSNATVGRCLSLVTRIIGGARENYADMATMGQPGKYTLCFAENEAGSPWAPFHHDQGFGTDDSTVTLVGVAGTLEIYEMDSYDPDEMIASLAPALANCAPVMPTRDNLVGGGRPIVLISPEWAEQFALKKISKREIKRRLLDASRRADDENARIAKESDDIVVIVAGGFGIKQTVVPNWNGGSVPITVAF